MPNKENIIGKGRLYSSTNQPERRGRRKRLVNILTKDYRLSIDDARDIMAYVLGSTRSELHDQSRDESAPAYMLAAISCMQQLIKRGNMSEFISAVEFQDRKSKGMQYDLSGLSDDALLKIAEIIQNDRQRKENEQEQ